MRGMKGTRVGILFALLLCLPILLMRATSDYLLQDSDTKFLLLKLAEYNDPWRWFTHDWPLENHFYRPISTLVFEADWRLHPGNAAAFGLTNALLCCLCALGVFWLAWELFQSIPRAIVAQAIFVGWTVGWVLPFVEFLSYLVLPVLLVRMIWAREVRWDQIWVGAASMFVPLVLFAMDPKFSADTLGWLPGRTATSMTAFCLVASAAYLRFERLGAARLTEPAPSATDVPATRSSVQKGFTPKNRWGWFALSIGATALAMGAYEQAVMLPFVMFGLGVWLRGDRIQTRFALQMVFWLVLFAYVIVRLQFIPIKPSGYQSQQFRSGSGWMLSLSSYLVPALPRLKVAIEVLGLGAIIMVTSSFWTPALFVIGNVGFWVSGWSRWKRLALTLVLATTAYLPMAFLHQFGHYHYWPGAFMAVFAVLACEQFWRSLVSAVSPRALQAPPRSGRAPGSLPHL